MKGGHRPPLAGAAVAACALLAACSSSPDASSTGGDEAATTSSTASGSTAPSAAPPATSPSGAAPAPTPRASPARTATPAPHPAGAPLRTPAPSVPSVGAAPGAYAVHMSVSSTLGSPFDGAGTLTVAAVGAGGTQDETLTGEGRTEGATTTYGYLANGEVTIDAIGAGAGAPPGCSGVRFAFTPPVEAVPPHPAVGATWSGSVSGGGVTGTYTGAVVGQATDSVGGVGVAVWRLHGAVDLTGTVCGFGVSGTVTLDSDWAPSLRLPVTMTTTSAVTAALLLTIHSTTSSQLLRTTPG